MRGLVVIALVLWVGFLWGSDVVMMGRDQLHKSACRQSGMAWNANTGFRIYPDRYYDTKICNRSVRQLLAVRKPLSFGPLNGLP